MKEIAVSSATTQRFVRQVPNKKFIGFLILFIVLSTAGLFGMNLLQVDRMKEYLLSRARVSVEKGEHLEGSEFASRYLLLEPDNEEALSLLLEALSHFDHSPSSVRRSIFIASRLLRIDENNDEVRLRRVRSMLHPAIQLYSDALEDLVVLLETSRTDTVLWSHAGDSLFARNGQHSDDHSSRQLDEWLSEETESHNPHDQSDILLATKCYRHVIRLLDQHFTVTDGVIPDLLQEHRQRYLDTTIKLARIYRTHPKLRSKQEAKLTAEADTLMDGLLKGYPKWHSAYLARYEYRVQFQYGTEVAAAADLEEASRLEPNNAEVMAAVIQQAIRRREFDAAQKLVERGLTLFPADSQFRVLRWHLVNTRDGASSALALWETGAEPIDDNVSLLIYLIEGLIDEGRTEEATDQIARLEKISNDLQLSDFYRGLVAWKNDHHGEAIRRFQDVHVIVAKTRPELAAEARYHSGNCYEQLQQYDRALEAYSQAVTLFPSMYKADLAKANLLIRLNRFEEAIALFRRLRTTRSGNHIRRESYLRNLSLSASRMESASTSERQEFVQLLEEARSDSTDSLQSALLEADCFLLRGRVNEAIVCLDQVSQTIENASKDSISEDLQKEYCNKVVGCHLKAIKAYQDEDKSTQEEFRQHSDQISKTLHGFESRFGDSLFVRSHRSKLMLLEKRESDATRVLTEDLDQLELSEQAGVYMILARRQMQAGHTEQSRKYFQAAADLNSTHLLSRLNLLDLAIGRRDSLEVQRFENEIRALEGPDQTLSKFATAWRLMAIEGPSSPAEEKERAERLLKAYNLLKQVQSVRPSWPQPYVLLAMSADQAGKTQEAIRLYQKAVDLGYLSEDVTERLLILLANENRFQEAALLLKTIEKEGRLSSGLEPLAVGILWENGEQHAALGIAQRAVQSDPDQYKSHLRIASMLEESEDLVGAERAFRAAVERTPQEPLVWEALVLFHARARNLDKLRLSLQEAVGIIPLNRELLLKAKCSELLSADFPELVEKAISYYRQAAQESSNNPAVLLTIGSYFLQQNLPSDAIEIFSQALKLQPEDPQTRRLLAKALGARGDLPSWLQAIELVNKNRTAQQEFSDVADLNIYGRLLLLRGGATHLRLAQSVFEQLIATRSASVHDHFLLATICFLRAQREESTILLQKAQEHMLYVLARDSNNAYYVSYFAESLLNQRDIATADPWLDRLDELEPGSVRGAGLRAKSLHLAGHTEDAITLLLKLADSLDVSNPMTHVALKNIASTLESMGQVDEAEQVYRRWANAHVNGRQALAAALARNKRVDEAIDLLEEIARDPAHRAEVINLALQIGSSWRVLPQDFSRIETWIQSGLSEEPESTAYLLQLAELEAVRGNYSQAVTIFRQLAKGEEVDSSLLNNLAWSLGKLGQPSQGIDYIDRAIKQFGPLPNLLDTQAVLVHALQEKEKYVLAQTLLQKAIDLDPAPDYLFHLAQVERSLGNTSRAVELCEEVVQKGGAEVLPIVEQEEFTNLANWAAVRSP